MHCRRLKLGSTNSSAKMNTGEIECEPTPSSNDTSKHHQKELLIKNADALHSPAVQKEEKGWSNRKSRDDGNADALPVGPDGGYGWIIVGCAFMCIFFLDGIGSTYALLLPEINAKFKTTPAISSLGNSFFLGTLLLIAMPASFFIKRFGCRPVAFTGACLAGGGFAASFLASNIWLFLPAFGIIGGGIGLFYLPSVILVNSYFTRKRGIAQGILNSGSGFGIVILSHLMKVLLEFYGLQGAVLIMSGVVLQLCIAASLMRPLYLNIENSKAFLENKLETSNKSKRGKGNFEQYDLLKQSPSIEKRGTELEESIENNFDAVTVRYNRDLEKHIKQDSIHSSYPYIPQAQNIHNSFRSDRNLSTEITKPSAKRLLKKLEFNPFLRKDIFYSGSLYNLEHHKYSRNEVGVDEKILSSELIQPRDHAVPFCDMSLLTNKALLLLATGAMLTQMGQYIPLVFLGDYALQIGLNMADITLILSLFGIVNTLGRLLAGVLTRIPKLTPLTICNIGNYTCALTLFLFPFCTTFWTLCAFAVVHALFVGFFAPMQPLMTVDYLGLDKLTPAFGIITFCKAPAAIFGPPIAGNLYQQTQSYSASNAFAGGLFFASAFVQMLIPFCNRKRSKCTKGNKKQSETEQFIDTS